MSNPSEVSSRVLFRPILFSMLAYGLLTFLLPIYARDLNANALEIGGLFTAFSITALAVRPVVGWGLDRLGRKRFLVAAFLTYALALAVMALASNLPLLYLSRLVQGVASSLLWITAYTISVDLSPAGERGRAVALVDGASAQGMLFGSIPGFVLLMLLPLHTAWPLLFAAYALAALYAAWLAWRMVPETRAAPVAPAAAPARPQPVHPLLYRLMAIVFITGMTSAMVAPIWLIYIQDHFTTEIQRIVWAYLPAALVYGFMPQYLGPLSDRFGRAPMMALGLAFAGLVSLGIPVLTRLPNGLWILALLWLLEATGFVLASPAQGALVADLTDSDQRGRGYGWYTLAIGLGAAAGPLLGGWLYDAVDPTTPFYANGAALLVCAGLVGILLGGWLRRRAAPAE